MTINIEVSKIKEIFSNEKLFEPMPSEDFFSEKYSFIYFYRPFINKAILEFREKIQENTSVNLNISSLEKNLSENLMYVLNKVSNPTLQTELTFAVKEKLIDSESDVEAQESFSEEFLLDLSYFEILNEEYPLLMKNLTSISASLLDYYLEIIENFQKDYFKIKKSFSLNIRQLNSIKLGKGDTHKNGKSVAILELNDKQKIVYKPRSLKIDLNFNEILKWVNDKGFRYPFKNVSSINFSTYGWQEYLSIKECKDISEIQRFYYRQGGYLALFYFLNSTDFHYENIIACGEYPKFIDLETLYSNYIEYDNMEILSKNAQVNLSKELKSSVLYTLMLPSKLNNIKGAGKIDISGLGDNNFDENLASSGYNFSSENVPLLNGSKVSSLEFLEDIIKGFKDMYSIFENNKNEIVLNNSLLASFGDTMARQVLRATNTYVRLLNNSYNPKYLKSVKEQEKLFNFLYQSTESRQKFELTIPYEIQELVNNDVPLFYIKFNSTSLYTSSGDEEMLNFFKQTPLEIIKNKILDSNISDMNKQLNYIRMSIQTLNKKIENKSIENYTKDDSKKVEVKGDILLNEALIIGKELVDNAFCSNDKKEAIWFGLNIDKNGVFELSTLRNDLYGGNLGIILYLAILSKETNNEIFNDYAKLGMQNVRNSIKDTYNFSVSGFFGLPSIAYVFGYVGILNEDIELVEEAKNILLDLDINIIKEETNSDFIGGLSSGLLIYIKFYERFRDERFLKIAKLIADRLEEDIKKSLKLEELEVNLAHGLYGMIWPLLNYSKLTNDRNKIELIEDMLEQLKDDEEEINTTWCSGAAGIGISNINNNILSSKRNIYERKIKKACELVKSKGMITQDGLCHGNFGIIDFLLTLSIQNNSEIKKYITNYISSVIERKNKNNGWNLGLENVNIYGFMIGISGIGYELLRLNNSSIKSVLEFDLPENKWCLDS